MRECCPALMTTSLQTECLTATEVSVVVSLNHEEYGCLVDRLIPLAVLAQTFYHGGMRHHDCRLML